MIRTFLALFLLLVVGCAERPAEPTTETDSVETTDPVVSAEPAPVALKWEQRTCPYQPKIIDPSLFYDW